MNVGYARTSTIDQTAGLAARERDLKAAGAARIFGEQYRAPRSGRSSPSVSPSCAKATCFTKPDRLARSTAELLGPAAIAKRLGIARSSVYRVLGA